MLWTILVVLLILWLLGFSFHIGGSLVHLLLVDCRRGPSSTWSVAVERPNLCGG